MARAWSAAELTLGKWPQTDTEAKGEALDAVRRRGLCLSGGTLLDRTAQGAEGNANEARARRLIKRYANRKLYDTLDSRYVTLQQIADLVREGEDVRIIDNTSKDDLTNVTLAQIIYEEEKKGEDGRTSSVRTLRTLIQEGRDRLMESLREGPMGKLLDAQGEPGAAGVPHLKSPKDMLDELHRMADEQVKALLGTAMGHVRELQEEVRRLQGRIEELEERLKGVGRRKRESEAPPPGHDEES